LSFALDNVEGDDGSVGESAGEHSSDHALEVVRDIVLVLRHKLLINYIEI
jgi:hypothetical protein